MKQFATALLLSLAAVPAVAQSVSFPTLTYPEPAPTTETVTQGQSGINK